MRGGLTSISSVAESVIVRTISTSPPTTVTFFSALAVVLSSMDVNAQHADYVQKCLPRNATRGNPGVSWLRIGSPNRTVKA
jgi:hypothetical protein